MHSEHTLQALFFTNSSSVHDHELKRTVGYSTRSGKQIRSDQIRVDIKRIISSMDGLEWNSTQRNEIEDGFFMVDDLPEDIFYQIHDGVCSSSPMMMMINRACGSISDIGMPVHSQQVLTKACDGDKTTDSLDSIDCLISTTSSAAVSSGESENNGSNPKTMINELVHELVSRNSSDRGKLKRKNYQSELNFGEFDLLHSDSSSKEGGFRLIHENDHPKAKKLRSEKRSSSPNINFQQPSATSSSISNSSSIEEPDPEAIAQMKEMIYRAAAFRPVNLGLDMVEKPKRKNVRISTDPQTVAARQRRERISERIRVLQKLVPGGSKMDTASMLDEAASYLKFLRSQVKALENLGNKFDPMNCPPPSNLAFSSLPFNHMQTHNFPPPNPNQIHHNSQS